MLSQLKLLGIYQRELSKNHGCAGAALEAVAEAAVKDAVGGDEPVHSRVWMTAPKSIWLQVDPDVDAADTDFNDQEEVTWAAGIDDCGIGENDIEYVRADLARPQASTAVPEGTAEVLSDLLCLIDNNLKFGCVPMAYIRAKALYRWLASRS